MGLATFARIGAILLLCLLALSGCQGMIGPFNPDQAMALAADAAHGRLGPDYKIYNIVDFGVKQGENANVGVNSAGFMRTWRTACFSTENAVVVIPEGTFITGPMEFNGPCKNPSPIIVLIKGTISANPDSSKFPLVTQKETKEWITFVQVSGLIITGPGFLNGQGEKGAWQIKNNQVQLRMPASLKLIYVNDTIVSGLTSNNPKGFHIVINWSNNIQLFDMKLNAPAESPNTDGIHMSRSRGIRIYNSAIATGDDCVSMIHGSFDVTVENVHCGPGHGFSVGSLGHYDNEQDVGGIVVANCLMTGTDNGVRIKAYKNNNPSRATGITFRDIRMDRVKNPIIIDQEYASRQSCQTSKVSIRDVFFTNIIGTTVSNYGAKFFCSPAVPCEGIHLNNVNLNYVGPPIEDPFVPVCANNVPNLDHFGLPIPGPCPSRDSPSHDN